MFTACGAPQTVGEACEEVATAFADRLIDCGAASYADRYAYIYGITASCCQGSLCQEDVASPPNVDRCVADTRDVSCAAMSSFAANPSTVPAPLPAICRGVATSK